MSFIYDDYDWKFIFNKNSFDESRFVIVRKLFVQLKNTSMASVFKEILNL